MGMKLSPVAKLDKSFTTMSKTIDEDIVSANYDIIVIFPTYGRFESI